MTEKYGSDSAVRERHFLSPRSLSTKLLLAALVSLLFAVTAYAAVYLVGSALVSRYYMSADAVAARKAAIYTELNRFVTEGEVAGNDADALQRFLAGRDYVSVTVYSAEELALPAALPVPLQGGSVQGNAGERSSVHDTAVQSAGIQPEEERLAETLSGEAPAAGDPDTEPETQPDAGEENAPVTDSGPSGRGTQSYALVRRGEGSGRLYPLHFADGIYYVAITDSSRTREDMVNRGMALLIAVAVLVSVLFWYTNRLTRRVIRLSQETATVGAGDLDGMITVDGSDEIAALAADIDGMRDAIIERMGNEKRAWEANSELITAMSHDIRTPMTSLIGYLGLLNSEKSLPEEESRRYLKAAYGKSLALKELTDELFKYFLVFGRSELDLNREEYDAHLLLMQLLGEAEFDLRDAGFQVQNISRLEDGALLETDAGMLKRVLDNLVSNIKKYAEPELPVVFFTERKEDAVCVTVSNGIRKQNRGTESTRIGLRTCEKILTALGGSFGTASDESHFAAEFTLPLQGRKAENN